MHCRYNLPIPSHFTATYWSPDHTESEDADFLRILCVLRFIRYLVHRRITSFTLGLRTIFTIYLQNHFLLPFNLHTWIFFPRVVSLIELAVCFKIGLSCYDYFFEFWFFMLFPANIRNMIGFHSISSKSVMWMLIWTPLLTLSNIRILEWTKTFSVQSLSETNLSSLKFSGSPLEPIPPSHCLYISPLIYL